MVRKPNFFLVGAPRCGTTSLYGYLYHHPEVFLSHRKEPFFFCTDIRRAVGLTEAEYLALFEGAGNAKRIGEGSTWYLYSDRAREGIKSFSPDARILIMLRNPVDMMYSWHSKMRSLGHETIADFEEALEAEEDRKKGLRLPEGYFLPLIIYRDVASYSGYVERYFETFGRDSVYVVLFEEFVTDTSAQFRQVCKFLEIDPTFQPLFLKHNPNMELRSYRLRRVTRSPLRKLGYGIPSRLRQRIKRRLFRMNIKLADRSPMRLELRQRLEEEFQPEVERLSRLLNRDLRTLWRRSEATAHRSPHPLR